jgi:hypothetical protein
MGRRRCHDWIIGRLISVQRLAKAILSFRLRLRSGLRQRGGVFDAVLYLGLRPRLVYRRAYGA